MLEIDDQNNDDTRASSVIKHHRKSSKQSTSFYQQHGSPLYGHAINEHALVTHTTRNDCVLTLDKEKNHL